MIYKSLAKWKRLATVAEHGRFELCAASAKRGAGSGSGFEARSCGGDAGAAWRVHLLTFGQ